MLTDQLRTAIRAAAPDRLPELAALLWRAFGEGHVSEAEAGVLSAEIEGRRRPSVIPIRAPKRRTGARPRTPESLARRRRWAASGALPPQVAAHFTQAEVAVLAVVTREVGQHGRCTLTIGHIASVAGVCPTSVRNALREARALGFITIEERRLSACRNAPNRVSVISAEWCAWIARRSGCKSVKPTNTKILDRKSGRLIEGKKEACGRGGKRRGRPRGSTNLVLEASPISDRTSDNGLR